MPRARVRCTGTHEHPAYIVEVHHVFEDTLFRVPAIDEQYVTRKAFLVVLRVALPEARHGHKRVSNVKHKSTEEVER